MTDNLVCGCKESSLLYPTLHFLVSSLSEAMVNGDKKITYDVEVAHQLGKVALDQIAPARAEFEEDSR